MLSSTSFASSLTLDKIGDLDLGGNMYSEWWYTSERPTFMGTADPDASVNLKFGEDTHTVTADPSGQWNYYSTLITGDHVTTITSGDQTITFTLHLGQTMPTETTTETATVTDESAVPVTGYNQVIGLSLGMGIILLASYLYMAGDKNKKAHIIQKFLNED